MAYILFLSICSSFHFDLVEHVYGNIVKGWDTFATSSETRPNTSRKTKIGDRDRIFSQSSVKFSPEAEFGGDQDDHDDDDDDMLEDGRYRKSRSGRGQYYD